MNGGNVVSPRALYPQFGETVGKVSGVDWLFGLDETDPWVKTYVIQIANYSPAAVRLLFPPQLASKF